MSQANVINNDRHTVGLSIPAFGSPHLVLRDQGKISDLGGATSARPQVEVFVDQP